MLSKIRPYISIDLETTGLGERSEILQLGAVLDNGTSEIEDLKKINYIIKKKEYNYGEAYALGMNAWIFEEIKKHMDRKETSIPVRGFNVVMQKFSELIVDCSKLALEFDKENPPRFPHPQGRGAVENKKIQLAGKNVGIFDRVKLDQECKTNNFTLPGLLQHRGIDVGSLFYDKFGYNPSLDEINRLTGRKEVSHDALDDALDVVHAIRWKVNLNEK